MPEEFPRATISSAETTLKTPATEESHTSSSETRAFVSLEDTGEDPEEAARITRLRSKLGLHNSASPATPSDEMEGAFNPEEAVKNVLSLPRAERPAALAELKAKLQARREAWVGRRLEIENILRTNPDTPKEEVMKKITEHAGKGLFSEEDVEMADQILDRYYTAHAKVAETRANFPDDHSLAEHLTGAPFPIDEAIEIKSSPISLDLYVKDAAKVRELREHLAPDSIVDRKFDGFASRAADGTFYSVINSAHKQKEGIAAHEEQHQINRLSQDIFDEVGNEHLIRQYLEDLYQDADSPENRREWMRKAFETEALPYAYAEAKNEVIAILKYGNGWSIARAIELFKPGAGHAYDYLDHIRELHAEDPIWKDLSDEILEREYIRVVQNSLTAAETLSKIYKPEEVISLLSPVRFEDWSKEASRIFQEKLEDPTIKPADIEKVKEKLDKEGGTEKESAGGAEKPGGIDENLAKAIEKAMGKPLVPEAVAGTSLVVAGVAGWGGGALLANWIGPAVPIVAQTGAITSFGGLLMRGFGAVAVDIIAWQFIKELVFKGGWKSITNDIFGFLNEGKPIFKDAGGGHAPRPQRRQQAANHAATDHGHGGGGGDHH